MADHHHATATRKVSNSEAAEQLSQNEPVGTTMNQNAPSVPPPYNPLAASTTNETVVGESVVPSLMKVYESMTGNVTAGAAADSNATTAAMAEAEKAVAATPWAITGAPPAAAWSSAAAASMVSNIPIPPVPPNAFAMEPAAAPGSYPPPPPPPESVASNNKSSPTSSNPRGGAGGRSLRKRSLRDLNAAAAAADSGLSVMAAAAASRSTKKSRRRSNASVSTSGSEATGENNTPSSNNSNKNNDGRWSKRFTWPEDLHRDFVAAIFDVGLKHSSPSTLLEQMPKHEQITTERIKSHLQKYRLHRIKSKQEFMTQYDSSLQRLQASNGTSMGSKDMNGGHLAGHLAYSTLTNKETATAAAAVVQQEEGEEGKSEKESGTATNDAAASAGKPQPQPAPSSTATGKQIRAPQDQREDSSNRPESLILPRLTEAEKKSPVGVGMGYLMGLFFSLKQQLMAQRAAEAAAKKAAEMARTMEQHPQNPHQAPNTPGAGAVAAVYNSFVDGQAPAPPVPSSATAAANSTTGTAAAGAVNDPLAAPSTRTNLEENSLMKREMHSQMVFQNKIRALKKQELEKYKGSAAEAFAAATSEVDYRQQQMPPPTTTMPHPQAAGEVGAATAESSSTPALPQQPQAVVQRPRGMSVGGNAAMMAAEEFWNTDMVDDQLFEFLMSDG
mmetsp:Transcript_4402/g.12172  ORF Transcript_4402/g.12172 Transcript_4402/m.12172 type:complete len:672 (+) Transcript_4402:681-2696(+)